MNKKRMKWIFFILILTCFPVVLVYANGAPMPGANNFNTNTPASNTGTGAPQPGANGIKRKRRKKRKKTKKKSKKMTIINLFKRKLKMLTKPLRTKMLLPRILKKLGKI